MVKKKNKAKKGVFRIFKKKGAKKAAGNPRKKKKGIKKPVKRTNKKTASKKVIRKPSKAREDDFVVGFEEVIVKCPSCGREFRVVKSSGFSMEGMLCQRCAAGGGVGLDSDDDF